ncbi:MAG TPA: sensor histidine kinase [Candidatus Hypogeohydataceae bacterium YC41]
MNPPRIITTKTLHKKGTNVVNPLPKQVSYSEDKERLIVLGKGTAELAHQLKNSLDGIRRFLSLSLACVDNKEKVTYYILNAEGALNRLDNMAESLLNFAKRERPANREPITLQRMLADILHLYEDKAKANGIKLVTHCDEHYHLPVPGDFYHVFLNLIKNAIEAMPLGGVLRVLTQVKGGKIEVAISDTGVGIPEHLRKKLFKPFFTTKGKDGTGLGLALSKEIVERYGGTISFESKTENGSTFSVIIPTI